jgi:hypothetical protein
MHHRYSKLARLIQRKRFLPNDFVIIEAELFLVIVIQNHWFVDFVHRPEF